MSRGSVRRDAERGSWYFVIDLPTADGRRQVKRRGFDTRKDAVDALNELAGSVRDGTFVERRNVSLEVYLKTWLDGLAATGRRPSTIAGYRQTLGTYVFGRDIGRVPIQALTPAHLNQLYGHLATKGARNGRALSLRTVRYLHTIIGKALSDALRQGMLQRNPARLANPPRSSATKAPEMSVWSPDELRAFLAHTQDHDLRHLFRLVAMTGLRRGEVCGLRWDDVDLDAARLTVRRSITSVGGKPTEGDVKTSRSRRSVDLDEATASALRTHRAEQAAARLLVGSAYVDRGYVFTTPFGDPIHPDSVSGYFERAVASSKLPRIRFHDLRHSHATHLLAAGVNPKVVSERLGHASVSFTLDTYGHVLPGQQASAAAAVAALVGG